MTILPIVIAPDPRLKIASDPITTIDDSIRMLVLDMFETMYNERGIGLAAVQVGVMKRLLVADVTWRDDDGTPGKQYVLINPEVVESSEHLHPYKEGCLSFPDQYADVIRPASVNVRYMNLKGETITETFTDLLATCIQHEIDHLNGKVFVDYISPVKRDIIIRKLKKMKKLGVFEPHDHSNCGHDHSHDHDHDHEHVHGEHCNHDHNL